MPPSVAEMETLKGPIDDIRAFCRVMELGSISAAARVMQETKGSISRRISRLEQSLGIQLLARTPRSVKPTESGEQFFAQARSSLVLLDDAVHQIRETDLQPRGHLRITAPIDLGTEILPPLLAQFRRQYPAITVALELTNARLDLSAHQIDIALRAAGESLPDMGYSALRLAKLPISLYASPQYLQHSPLILQPEDLFRVDLVMPMLYQYPQSLVLYQKDGRQETLSVKSVVSVDDYSCAHRMLQQGIGVGCLPAMIARTSLQSGSLVPVLPEWTLSQGYLYAITLNSLRSPTKLVVFKKFLQSWLAHLDS